MLMNASLKIYVIKKGSFWLKFSLAMKLNTQWQYPRPTRKVITSDDVQIRNVYTHNSLLFYKKYFLKPAMWLI